MTESQLLTLALSVIIPISVMIYSNSRVGEVSKRIDDLGARVDRLEKKFDNRIDELEKTLKAHIDNAFEHIKLLLELHEAKHHKN